MWGPTIIVSYDFPHAPQLPTPPNGVAPWWPEISVLCRWFFTDTALQPPPVGGGGAKGEVGRLFYY